MLPQCRSLSIRRVFVYTFASLAILSQSTAAPAAGELKESTSLQFVPADVAFYSTSLRMKEQFDAVLNSNAYAALKKMPAYKQAVGFLKAQLAQAPFAGELSKPENLELLKLLGEMVSQEVFVYGDDRFAELAELFAVLNNARQMGQLRDLIERGPAGATRNDPYHMIKMLDRNRAKLRAPNLILGFRIATPRSANNQLARLKALVEMQLAARPELKKRFKQARIAGSDYLTMKLDGSLVPWEQVPIKQYERKPGEFDKLLAHLKTMTLTVSIGVRENYVIVALGESTAHLKTIGRGELLYDRPELAPLRKQASKSITGVSYTSQQFARSFGQGAGQLQQMLEVAGSAYKKAKVDEKIKRQFQADLKKLQAAVETKSDAGATMSFSFRNSRGFEGYKYDWSLNETLDFSKKLSLLSHVGGNPIFFAVARQKPDPDGYGEFVEVVKKMYYYGEHALLGQLNDAQRTRYLMARDRVLPLIERLHKANIKYVNPALKDGQSATVLDAKIRSRQWFRQMPPAKIPLPMLEFGIVVGVSDAEKLKKGCDEYFEVAQKLYDAVREFAPDKIPAYKIPTPVATKTPAGTTYHYPQLKKLGIDEQIAPTAGLSKSVAVLSTSRKLAERVLASKPVTPPKGLLTDRNRKLGSASYFNWPALVDAIGPWFDYGFQQYLQRQSAHAIDEVAVVNQPEMKQVLDQIRTGLKILKCFRGMSSATYREGKATVTHYESIWRDLPK